MYENALAETKEEVESLAQADESLQHVPNELSSSDFQNRPLEKDSFRSILWSFFCYPRSVPEPISECALNVHLQHGYDGPGV